VTIILSCTSLAYGSSALVTAFAPVCFFSGSAPSADKAVVSSRNCGDIFQIGVNYLIQSRQQEAYLELCKLGSRRAFQMSIF